MLGELLTEESNVRTIPNHNPIHAVQHPRSGKVEEVVEVHVADMSVSLRSVREGSRGAKRYFR